MMIMQVIDIASRIQAAGRPLTMKLEPGSLDLKLATLRVDTKQVRVTILPTSILLSQ